LKLSYSYLYSKLKLPKILLP